MKKIINQMPGAVMLLTLVILTVLRVDTYAATLKQTDAYYVNDYANVLDQATEDLIISANVSLEEQTGAQVVVVTVNFTDGQSISDYAYALFNEWGIGAKDKNNGVLLLLAIGDDNYDVRTGTGLEQGLSPEILDDLLFEYLETDFAAKQYGVGTKKVFNAIIKQLESYYGISVGSGTVTNSGVTAQNDTGTVPPTDTSGGTSQPETKNTSSITSSLFGGFFSFFRSLFIILVIIMILLILITGSRLFRPVYRPRPSLFSMLFGGRSRRHSRSRGRYGDGRPPMTGGGRPPMMGGGQPSTRRPPTPGGGWPSPGGGMFKGGGGSTRGSGAGRSSASTRKPSPGAGMFGGGSRPSGGMRTGGGGSTRGSGAGRRK